MQAGKRVYILAAIAIYSTVLLIRDDVAGVRVGVVMALFLLCLWGVESMIFRWYHWKNRSEG